jgi:hypothetical protein
MSVVSYPYANGVVKHQDCWYQDENDATLYPERYVPILCYRHTCCHKRGKGHGAGDPAWVLGSIQDIYFTIPAYQSAMHTTMPSSTPKNSVA